MKKGFMIKMTAFLLMAGVFAGLTGCGAGNNAAESSAAESSTSQSQMETTEPGKTPTGTETFSADSPEKDVAVRHLLTVWSDYLQVLDKMYASELWAFDYAERYVNSGDWNDLTKARTACIASARYLSELAMTEADLTEEEYLVLFNAGIDTAYQSNQFQSIQASLEEAHMLVRDSVLETLEAGIFNSGRVDILKDQISVNREYIQHMSEYECRTTNYMLLSLGDETQAFEYWDAMPDKYPTLCMGYEEWIDDETEVLKAGDEDLDDLEKVNLKQSEVISSLNAELYTMNQIFEANDMEKLLSSAFIMKNTPELLPMPDWYDPQTAGYLSFILNEDGSVVYPESGDVLEDAAYGMYIQIEGLSSEEISGYIAFVKDLGQDAWKGEGEKWYIKMQDYSVMISLENETATLMFNGQDVTFAPLWYLGI